jgi:hypothetical protein
MCCGHQLNPQSKTDIASLQSIPIVRTLRKDMIHANLVSEQDDG